MIQTISIIETYVHTVYVAVTTYVHYIVFTHQCDCFADTSHNSVLVLTILYLNCLLTDTDTTSTAVARKVGQNFNNKVQTFVHC